jgi:hypothetical protein
MTTPILQLRELQQSQSQPHLILNEGLRRLEAACNISVVSIGLNVPPGSVADGAVYIVGTAPTGAWAGHADKVALVIGGTWQFLEPIAGWIAFNQGSSPGAFYYYDGSAWTVLQLGGGGSGTLRFQLACSDLVNPLEASTNVAYFRAPEAFTITAVRASLLVASSSGDVVVDIQKNGSTILGSAMLVIDATEKTSVTGPAVSIVDASVVDDDEITVEIVSPGDSPATAIGLIVTLLGDPV